MQIIAGDHEFEALIKKLNDKEQLAAYKATYDDYQPQLIPRILAHILVLSGSLMYGHQPSYLKFRAVEIIARVPYHSWSSAAFTLLTLFFSNEHKALRLSTTARYARIASDNETMHVVVISQLAKVEEKAGLLRHTVAPMLFAFFYYWSSYCLYLLRPRWSYELNYLFEAYAFSQYSKFLETRGDELKKKPVKSEFLAWYGRKPANQYDFFESVRNDEIVHRNQSIHEIDEAADKQRVQLLKVLLFAIAAVSIALLLSFSAT